MKDQTNMLPEETLDPSDWTSMRALGDRMLDDALDYVEKLRDRPVRQHAPPQMKAHFEGPPPLTPEPANQVYEEYLQYGLPH
jgi:aromatic-L-amino-acid/L-tryptophan decarboxylase